MALLDVPGLALLPESTIFLCLAIGRFNALTGLRCYAYGRCKNWRKDSFNALIGLSCYCRPEEMVTRIKVSMPSWAWIVTVCWRTYRNDCYCFNALMGLNCYSPDYLNGLNTILVSMPSWAWIVTARMSNILNFHDTFYAYLLFIGVY